MAHILKDHFQSVTHLFHLRGSKFEILRKILAPSWRGVGGLTTRGSKPQTTLRWFFHSSYSWSKGPFSNCNSSLLKGLWEWGSQKNITPSGGGGGGWIIMGSEPNNTWKWCSHSSYSWSEGPFSNCNSSSSSLIGLWDWDSRKNIKPPGGGGGWETDESVGGGQRGGLASTPPGDGVPLLWLLSLLLDTVGVTSKEEFIEDLKN